ncbi:MAG TPA: M28 family peptidase [Pyrinomonadaceae bacterium]|nr:M28 family peptidase [Pyrinomonadaceae bacterium]
MNPENPVQKPTLVLATLLLFALSANLLAQNGGPSDVSRALSGWILNDAPPGREHLFTDIIMREMPGWRRDQLGNLILRKGSGSPRRVVACALDRPGFAVTEITDDGYLRLREIGGGRQHPLWIQFHEGQRIRVLTRAGVVPGVVIVKSTHLQRGRVANAPVTTLDDLWVDVGAGSKADVRQLGIEMLDPVVRDVPSASFGYDFVFGPLAGVRVGCAAVATATARGKVISGETIFLLTTLRSFGHDGLEAALRTLGRVDEVTLLDQITDATAIDSDGLFRRKLEKPAYLPESTGLTSLTVLAPKVRFAGSLVETVQLDDAKKLLAAVEKLAHVDGKERITVPWFGLIGSNAHTQTSRRDFLSGTADLLKSLADVPSVSGHEWEVRDAIKLALPAWAQSRVRTDNEGNLIVEVGPDRDPMMFIAHLDEVGFEITNIATDGTVSLRTRGGLFPSLWEGQPARITFDEVKLPLTGVFVPRESATAKQPEAVTAWFGYNGAALKDSGVKVGSSVTALKSATRLGATRFTARALDDRAGSTALLLAMRRIVPSTLKRKVVFAWSVREETGLEGAMALARQYGPTLKRVYSVDTFVSSDSPVETTRFAHAPLGRGAVIRGLDNSSIAPLSEIDRILRIARTQNISLQVGATNGGTDGSDFVRYGVLHVGLSWPGRYSHSPVEVLDLRDLEALERLIYAISTAP